MTAHTSPAGAAPTSRPPRGWRGHRPASRVARELREAAEVFAREGRPELAEQLRERATASEPPEAAEDGA